MTERERVPEKEPYKTPRWKQILNLEKNLLDSSDFETAGARIAFEPIYEQLQNELDTQWSSASDEDIATWAIGKCHEWGKNPLSLFVGSIPADGYENWRSYVKKGRKIREKARKKFLNKEIEEVSQAEEVDIKAFNFLEIQKSYIKEEFLDKINDNEKSPESLAAVINEILSQSKFLSLSEGDLQKLKECRKGILIFGKKTTEDPIYQELVKDIIHLVQSLD